MQQIRTKNPNHHSFSPKKELVSSLKEAFEILYAEVCTKNYPSQQTIQNSKPAVIAASQAIDEEFRITSSTIFIGTTVIVVFLLLIFGSDLAFWYCIEETVIEYGEEVKKKRLKFRIPPLFQKLFKILMKKNEELGKAETKEKQNGRVAKQSEKKKNASNTTYAEPVRNSKSNSAQASPQGQIQNRFHQKRIHKVLTTTIISDEEKDSSDEEEPKPEIQLPPLPKQLEQNAALNRKPQKKVDDELHLDLSFI